MNKGSAHRWLAHARRRLAGRGPLPVWHHPAYRLPAMDALAATGLEPRRADLALWALLGTPNRHGIDVLTPRQATWTELERVHTPEHLQRLTVPASLATMFGLSDEHFPVDGVLSTVRRATGGTLAATQHVLEQGGNALNLLGGFHHASPDRGAGFCPINDVAIAIAAARARGFNGQVVVLDLDAHPPDGLADCLASDPSAWVGSLSGSDWGPLDVDETVIEGADDLTYLDALSALLARMPAAELAFVLAGGDVLATDPIGALALTMTGVSARDALVQAHLAHTPSVWLPAGGYHNQSWRILAQTAITLLDDEGAELPPELDPMGSRFAHVARRFDPRRAADESPWLSEEDIGDLFGPHRSQPKRLLGTYTEQGAELALHAYGLLEPLEALGYHHLSVALDRAEMGDRLQLTGEAQGERHLLIESVLRIESFHDEQVLYQEWLNLRHPLGSFSSERPRLPGQDVPGLGMAPEAGYLLDQIALRLRLAGVLWRPSWVHTAWMARHRYQIEPPEDQGAFDALMRDLGHLGIGALSRAVAAGRVTCNEETWAWPAPTMIHWLDDRPRSESESELVATARDRLRFRVAAEVPRDVDLEPPDGNASGTETR